MDTEKIMEMACNMVGFSLIPVDSKIYVSGKNIRKVLFGIDITSAEIKIAKDLGYDLVIAHHPHAIPGRYELFREHVTQMVKEGVPLHVAKAAVETKIESFELEDYIVNYDHVISIARLLNVPFMNIHQPCDEMGRRILQNKIDKQISKNPESNLQDIVNALHEIPEFNTAYTDIKIRIGSPDKRAGRVKVSHGAYSNGGYEIASAYFNHGVDTVVYIHIKQVDLQKLLKENKGSLIVTGHLVSDEIGINPFIDILRKKGLTVDVISGLLNRYIK